VSQDNWKKQQLKTTWQFSSYSRFLPREAMLTWYMLSMCVRLSVRPSIRHTTVLYQNS